VLNYVYTMATVDFYQGKPAQLYQAQCFFP